MSDIKSLLEKLSNAHGISGWEGSIQQIVKEEIAPYVDEVRMDKLGNLIATKKGELPSIMIEAHADEIGLMAKHVDEKGFLRFIRIGGWFDQTLLNQRVIIHTRSGPITGVIGCKPPHVMKDEDRKKVVEAKDMFIDIGCTNQKEVEDLGILPGTPISIDRTFASLQGDRVTGKAFDNRAGLISHDRGPEEDQIQVHHLCRGHGAGGGRPEGSQGCRLWPGSRCRHSRRCDHSGRPSRHREEGCAHRDGQGPGGSGGRCLRPGHHRHSPGHRVAGGHGPGV